MNKILCEGVHGHGAIKKRFDLRDLKWGKHVGRASAPFDWSVGFDSEALAQQLIKNTSFATPTKDQGTSGSCGGQSSSYLMAQLGIMLKDAFDERSAKYIYSQIFYPGGGTTLRDILNLIVKKGSCREALCLSYDQGQPPAEPFMEQNGSNSTTDADALLSKATGYAFVAPNIDAYAQAIRDNGGVIMELSGENNGTWLSSIPTPPTTEEWRHFVYCGRAKLINGKKYIGFHNSWGQGVGDGGWQWLSEDYFNSGFIYQGGVIFEASNATQTPNVKAQISLIGSLLALLQQLINTLTGKGTKIVLN